MKLSNRMYDFLKHLAQIYLPAAGTLYAGLAVLWHLPAVEQVGGTVLLVDTFLGICLGISSSSYRNSPDQYDGKMFMSTNPVSGKKTYSLQLNDNIENLDDKKQIVFEMQNISAT